MLFVRFTDVPDTRIQDYERLTFAEAVVATHDLHQARSEEGTSCPGDFRLFDQKDELLYRGTFTFGTEGTYPNLYYQVKDRVQRIRTKKEENAKKMWLLDEIETERLGLGERLTGVHDSKLLSVGHDDADFRGADSVVDPRHVAETTPILVSLWLSDGFVLQWVDATSGLEHGQSRGKSERRGS
jgi:hypothetical protein